MLQTPELSTQSQIFPPCHATTTDPRISARELVRGVLSGVEFHDFLKAVVRNFGSTHIQNQQCLEAAHFLGVDVETVRRWVHGMTTPKARDFWPLAFVVILQNLPVPAQQQLMATVAGMARQ